ncbi:hypothetical protein DPQ33_06590 [Oceanidesulfovibrio indonesiensis]|uniref:Acyltransferase 3 domain-containing protein n=1 Tax=Oceanidesulfovibrio indonesiensis TaxID=54767 RepID=A0A7M3MH81_9BACT|nr:acyltransferase family protein [Oceanidesulfovibrio indonesiensis]TVM18410.1 hypothetical protein DPQ33_06590 [Oceanidesulfovibrio indonesiensis]
MSKTATHAANTVGPQDLPEPPSSGRHPQRIYYLDMLRVLAIFAVVAIHAIGLSHMDTSDLDAWWIGHTIITFSYYCVPVLVMISGAMLLSPGKQMPLLKFYRKRLPKIVIPLAVWSFFYYLCDIHIHDRNFWFPTYFKRLMSVGLEGHLWFLYMITGLYLMTPFIRAMLSEDEKNNTMRTATSFLLVYAVFSTLLFFFEVYYQIPPYSFLSEAVFSLYIFYFILGHVLHRVEIPRALGLMLSPAVFFISAIITYYGHYRYAVVLETTRPYFFNHGAPFIMLMGASFFIFFKSLRYKDSPFMRIVIQLSSVSYGIYLCHVLVLKFLNGELLPIFDGTIFSPFTPRSFEPFLSGPLLIIVAYLLSLGIALGFQRSKYLRWMVP